jgi:hypothetical protein
MYIRLELDRSSLESVLRYTDIGLCLRYTRRYRIERSYNYLYANSLDPVNSLYCPEFHFVHLYIRSVVYNWSDSRGE